MVYKVIIIISSSILFLLDTSLSQFSTHNLCTECPKKVFFLVPIE